MVKTSWIATGFALAKTMMDDDERRGLPRARAFAKTMMDDDERQSDVSNVSSSLRSEAEAIQGCVTILRRGLPRAKALAKTDDEDLQTYWIATGFQPSQR